MKCVKIESYVVEAGTDRPSLSWVGFAGSRNWWWILISISIHHQLLLPAKPLGPWDSHTYGSNLYPQHKLEVTGLHYAFTNLPYRKSLWMDKMVGISGSLYGQDGGYLWITLWTGWWVSLDHSMVRMVGISGSLYGQYGGYLWITLWSGWWVSLDHSMVRMEGMSGSLYGQDGGYQCCIAHRYYCCVVDGHCFVFMFVLPYILVTYMFNSSPTRCTLSL
jgi:hypothetical protein